MRPGIHNKMNIYLQYVQKTDKNGHEQSIARAGAGRAPTSVRGTTNPGYQQLVARDGVGLRGEPTGPGNTCQT